jgi:hypothetical protein
MIVDLEERIDSGTFELKGGGKVHLKLLSAQDLKDMRRECNTKKVEYPLLDGQYRRFESVDTDSDKWVEMLYDRTITGWDDLYDRNGKPVPVTAENKLLLINKVPAFLEAYEAGMKVLKAEADGRAEASEKNLLNSPSGDPA